MSFGYGEVTCPDCYKGEEPFIYPYKNHWLNGILARLRACLSTLTTKPPIFLSQF